MTPPTASLSPVSPTLIDGEPGESVSITQRALQYGDGLFETITCIDGMARWMSRHLARLRTGCERLRIAFDEEQALRFDVSRLAAGQPRCIVKVIISRGGSTQRGYRPAGDERATRIVSRHPWPLQPDDTSSLRVALSEVRLGINPHLAGLKHLNRLEQVLAQMHRPAQLDEVLMCDSDGELVGGSMSNLFLVDAQGLFTPPVQRCGVAGVMRARVLEATTVALRSLPGTALGQMREAFLTNVRWGIRSIGVLDGRSLPSDDYARRLRRLLDASDA